MKELAFGEAALIAAARMADEHLKLINPDADQMAALLKQQAYCDQFIGRLRRVLLEMGHEGS